MLVNKVVISVHVDGDKSGFLSKNAVERFKSWVKNNSTHNLNEASKNFLKEDFMFELASYENNTYRFKVVSKPKNENNMELKKKMLKEKIKIMRNQRTNIGYYKAKMNPDVSDDILKEYSKLTRAGANVPIPEPSEILSNPEQYKPFLQMMLSNKFGKQMGGNNPYFKYIKMLAEKIGLKANDVPIQETTDVLNVKGNELNTNNDQDTDTDSESEKAIEV
jgi:hypothetical protein